MKVMVSNYIQRPGDAENIVDYPHQSIYDQGYSYDLRSTKSEVVPGSKNGVIAMEGKAVAGEWLALEDSYKKYTHVIILEAEKAGVPDTELSWLMISKTGDKEERTYIKSIHYNTIEETDLSSENNPSLFVLAARDQNVVAAIIGEAVEAKASPTREIGYQSTHKPFISLSGTVHDGLTGYTARTIGIELKGLTQEKMMKIINGNILSRGRPTYFEFDVASGEAERFGITGPGIIKNYKSDAVTYPKKAGIWARLKSNKMLVSQTSARTRYGLKLEIIQCF